MRLRFIPLALFFFCHLAWSGPVSEPSAQPTVAEQYLFASANAERTQRGLQPLRWDDALYRAADGHDREMAARASISHQYPGEAELAARGQQAGAHFSVILENVAEAPTAVQIQEAWMNSPGHRANLLDPKVNSIGIRVIGRGGELYAVEDFASSLVSLSPGEQESAVESALQSTSSIAVLPASEDTRRTCGMVSGYAGDRQPGFIMRYTAADLTKLPDELKQQVGSGQYHQAAVGACAAATQNFSTYSIVVMLYR
jgi:uncharacterized iron-regulated membrane protein